MEHNYKTSSMTGFGRVVLETSANRYTIEAKSVNHRFLEVSVKGSSLSAGTEVEIKNIVNSVLKRGKVDIYIKTSPLDVNKYKAAVDSSSIKQELESTLTTLSNIGVRSKIIHGFAIVIFNALALNKPASLSATGGEDLSENEITTILAGVKEVVQNLFQSRIDEGIRLGQVLDNTLDQLRIKVVAIQDKVRKDQENIYNQLRLKVKELLLKTELSEDRIAHEVALLVQKSDVSEEIARLNSHITQFLSELHIVQSGKKLDFLLQEMSREISTLLAKSAGIEVNKIGLDSRLLIEQLREQVQNVE